MRNKSNIHVLWNRRQMWTWMSGMINVARTLQYRKKLTYTALSTNTPHFSICVLTAVSMFLAIRVNLTILNDLNSNLNKWDYLFEGKDSYITFSKTILSTNFQFDDTRCSWNNAVCACCSPFLFLWIRKFLCDSLDTKTMC